MGCDILRALQFSLAVLCSSLFVFNTFGAIDEASIKQLSFITSLSKHVHIKTGTASDDPSDFQAIFPQFLWVLRDFTLKLKDKHGSQITERECVIAAFSRCRVAN